MPARAAAVSSRPGQHHRNARAALQRFNRIFVAACRIFGRRELWPKSAEKSLLTRWRRVPFRRSAVGWVRYHAGKPDIEGKLRRRQRYSGKAEEAGAVLRICNQLKKLQDRLLSHNRIFISETFLYSTAYQLHLFSLEKCESAIISLKSA